MHYENRFYEVMEERDILSSPRTDSALTLDKIKPIYEIDPKTGRDYIIQEPQAHGLTDIVDNYAGYATRIPIENGVLYQLEGYLNGLFKMVK